MPGSTPVLNLYKPGGGSTGLITPDEVVDVDRFNGNADLIDQFAGATDTRLDNLESVTAVRIVKVRRDAAQSLPTGAFTAIEWDAEEFDRGALHATDTEDNRKRLVAPVAGLYRITASGGLNPAVNARIAMQFRKNGAAIVAGGTLAAGSAGSEVGVSASTVIEMAANDYIEVQMYHEAGSSRNTATAGYSKPTAVWEFVAPPL